MKKFSERVNYSIENGIYCGHCVNLPILVQANSLEEMKSQIMEICKVWLKELQQVIDEDRFEYVDETLQNPLINKTNQ